jgi:hypothetical protein
MNVAERYRATIDELTDHHLGGPDLVDVISRGRRKRRARRTLVAVGAVAALTVAGAGGAWLHRPHEVVAVDRFASTPSFQDFVPGTDVDETIQAAVAEHVAGVPDADQVYPSDWNHDTALPDAQAQNATDWEAHYPLSAREGLWVSMFKPIPGESAPTTCRPWMDHPGLPCSVTTQADGSVLVHYGIDLETSYELATTRVDADGFVVQTFDDVVADSWHQAEARASLAQGQLEALVNDASMTFPDPVVTPPPPTSK